MLQSIIPDPLHPAIVHMPIALAVLVPVVAAGALWAIRRGAKARIAWGITVGTLAALLFSGWLSLQTGEQQEERVEDAVAENNIHAHEEAAEAFMLTTGIVLVLAAGGLFGGRIGRTSRGLATLGTLAILGAGYRVGHSGGELVYRYGAASAYTNGSATTAAGDERTAGLEAVVAGGRGERARRKDRDER